VSATVREATADDHDAAMLHLDTAMLEADSETVRARIDAGSVLVAEADGRIVGVCVLDEREGETEITQIAVHRARRDRGVGTALVETASERFDGPLTAEFREEVRPFYESLGFEIAETDDDDRFRGVRG
jgi:N-acetylglutamate synthase-like GNAT family acetyltransferase